MCIRCLLLWQCIKKKQQKIGETPEKYPHDCNPKKYKIHYKCFWVNTWNVAIEIKRSLQLWAGERLVKGFGVLKPSVQICIIPQLYCSFLKISGAYWYIVEIHGASWSFKELYGGFLGFVGLHEMGLDQHCFSGLGIIFSPAGQCCAHINILWNGRPSLVKTNKGSCQTLMPDIIKSLEHKHL